ncbi:MAG: glycosyltransferase [Pseudomonadota bacterium]
MDILFIAPAFQPYCAVAATRPAACARYLISQGHSVRILAARNTRYRPMTDPGIDPSLITYVDMWHPQDVAAKLMRPFKRRRKSDVQTSGRSVGGSPAPIPKVSPLKAAFYDAFDYTFNYPDSYMGWIKNAKRAGAGLINDRRPDVIFSSGPPHSANVVAAALTEQFDVPWVAEYRDLWMDHPYHVPGAIRRFFEERLEMRTVSKANALVAVSEDACANMRARFHKECTLSYNGFDPALFDKTATPQPLDPKKLTIVYAGSFYVRTRTPEPLFAALKALNASPDEIEVRCYSSTAGIVRSLAESYGLEAFVKVFPSIPNEEVLAIQRQADVLLLMRWDDPREEGVIPGKVFEYIGADRPILSIGRTTGEVAALLEGRADTQLVSDTNEICRVLRTWLEQRKSGRLPDVGWDKRDIFTRARQFEKVERALLSVV